MRFRSVNIMVPISDAVGTILLGLYGLLIGPLGVLRGPIVLERWAWYCAVLLPQGLMTRTLRAAIDWRLGNFDNAISQIESLINANEDYYKAKPASRARKRILEDLYTVLVRAYLHAGHIDDAMLAIIRAKKCLDIERLGGLAELDVKTAHLVRAGLSAGRLLDGGGLATFFVKPNQKLESSSAPHHQSKDRSHKNQSHRSGKSARSARKGASRGDGTQSSSLQSAVPDEAVESRKVIPFPPGGRQGGHYGKSSTSETTRNDD